MARSLLSHRCRLLFFSLRSSSLEPLWKVTVVSVHVHVHVHIHVSVYVYVPDMQTHTDTEPSTKHISSLQFPLKIAEAELFQVAARSCGCSADLRCKCGPVFFFKFCLCQVVFGFGAFPLSFSTLSLSCPVCRSQRAHVCAFTTSPCVQAKRPHALNMFLPVHTGTF